MPFEQNKRKTFMTFSYIPEDSLPYIFSCNNKTKRCDVIINQNFDFLFIVDESPVLSSNASYQNQSEIFPSIEKTASSTARMFV